MVQTYHIILLLPNILSLMGHKNLFGDSKIQRILCKFAERIINDNYMNAQTWEIEDRLRVMGKYFDLDALLAKNTDNEAVEQYYRKTDFFYKLVHDRGGRSIHHGLSEDGFYHKDDFLAQPRYVGSFLDRPSMNVLEVGAGRLINSRYLAKEFPSCHFTAVDLPNRNFLKNRVPSNVELREGDYNDLSMFPDNSFDVAFGVETICYAESKERVYSEIYRVLKPGGRLIVFDGYEPKPQEEMTELERYTAAIICAAMCVTPKDHYIGNTRKYLEARFSKVEITDFSRKIRPTLRRMDRICGYYFMHPGLIRFTQKFFHADVNLNSIAGWLMLLSTDGETIHQYNRVVAVK